jgi:leucyl/phenylalanyl-tRNA--protein transferase
MFSKVSNASKVAFISLVKQPRRQLQAIGLSVYNPHLESLGCREIDRVQFMDLIRNKD